MKGKLVILASLLSLLLIACGSSEKTKKVDKTLDDVVTAIESSVELSDDKMEPSYEMIGAIGGVKYVGSKLELYEYDMDSDAYKDVSKDMKITLEGFNLELTASAINGQFVLFCEDSADKDKIIESFNNACK